MNTNTSLTGSGETISAQVSGTIYSPINIFRSKRDAFINKYYNEIGIVFTLVLFAFTVGLLSYKIYQLKSIASGIFIEANYDRIIDGKLTPRDFKIMKDIDMSPYNIFKQKQEFDDRY